MKEGIGNGSNELETQLLPQPCRADVGFNNEVELHRLEAQLSCSDLRMFTHRRCEATSPRLAGHHVSAIADMASGPRMILLDVVRTKDLAGVFRDERLDWHVHPLAEGLLLGDPGVIRVRVSR